MSRIMGYAELVGRLFVVVNGREKNHYVPPESGRCVYFFHDTPSCLHGHVFAGLGHDEDSLRDALWQSARFAYTTLGYKLTPRATTLAVDSQNAQDDSVSWGRCVRDAMDTALAVPDEWPADRFLGDLTVRATVKHLAIREEPPCVTDSPEAPAVGPGTPRLDLTEPAGLWDHAMRLWGVTPAQPLPGGHVVDTLLHAGWTLSPRGRTLIDTAVEADRAGHPWTQIADLLETHNLDAEPVVEGVDR